MMFTYIRKIKNVFSILAGLIFLAMGIASVFKNLTFEPTELEGVVTFIDCTVDGHDSYRPSLIQLKIESSDLLSFYASSCDFVLEKILVQNHLSVIVNDGNILQAVVDEEKVVDLEISRKNDWQGAIFILFFGVVILFVTFYDIVKRKSVSKYKDTHS